MDATSSALIKEVIDNLISMCVKNNNQVFATTHSDVVVDSFLQLIEERKFNDVAVLRFDKNNEEYCSVYQYDDLISAKELNLEIR